MAILYIMGSGPALKHEIFFETFNFSKMLIN